ncbi:MAG: UvrB/UvrC motif-containing protein [Candidatus Omnitrophica bacterium]|nr:UvrB/UvrC motif-containing protein [Candidatus Omnitrophota bacterium]MBU1924616.1 UvrB/UvrC motif-containing protein [Candidatus Omnitrophota bacterium]MBU2063475.1 UvrB/UvrC motif-containing protein [Candidatus Omnitrophota bacterium]
MVCQICQKRSATVHLTEIINDQMTELHLCEQCAKEKGIAGLGQPFGLQDLLTGLVDFGTPVESDKKAVMLQCPNCKMNYEDFRKIGRLGCSQCYETFKKSLEPLLKKIHGSVQHLGKAPARGGKVFKTKRELQDLKLKLQKAIEMEEFEEAAKLRDKIKQMEQEDK